MTNEPIPYVRQYCTWRTEGGTKSLTQGNIELSMITNSDQGFAFYENGNVNFRVHGTYKEVVGFDVTKGQPAKIINAINGNIEIRAPRGQITLVAQNIRLVSEGGGEVTISADKIIQLTSPKCSVQGDDFSVATSKSVTVTSGVIQRHGELGVRTTIGTDQMRTSFLGKILKVITDVENFFKSSCK